jgi:O-antigen/teichoic acid export membrane protein
MVRDGVWLSLGAAITSVAGMACWVLSAHLVDRATLGVTAAWTSAFLLVTGLTQAGLGSAVLRWVPRAGGRAGTLLGRAYLAIVAGAVGGTVVLVAVPSGRAAAAPVITGGAAVPGAAVLFGVVTLAWAVMQFQDPVLTGLDRAGTVLARSAGFAVGRVGILLATGPVLGALGILLSWTVPAACCAAAGAVAVLRAVRRRRAAGAPGVLPGRREVAGLLAPTAVGTIGQSVLYYLLPLIVTERGGPAVGAVFFVLWTAVNALDVAATSFVNALTVRAAADPGRSAALVRVAGSRLLVLFGGLVAAGIGLAGPLLGVFGPAYAQLGAAPLRLVLAAFLPRLVVLVAVGLLQARGRGTAVAGLQLGAAITMLPVAWLAPAGDLVPIAWGFVVVQVLLAGVAVPTVRAAPADPAPAADPAVGGDGAAG